MAVPARRAHVPSAVAVVQPRLDLGARLCCAFAGVG
jgi:hypothetical protein